MGQLILAETQNRPRGAQLGGKRRRSTRMMWSSGKCSVFCAVRSATPWRHPRFKGLTSEALEKTPGSFPPGARLLDQQADPTRSSRNDVAMDAHAVHEDVLIVQRADAGRLSASRETAA